MKHKLTEDERNGLDHQIAEAEKITGAQIVMASVKRSDSYAEIPWKAFAIGISVAGFLVFITDLLFLKWVTNALVPLAVGSTLAAGIVLAGLTVLFPGIARLFLSKHRREMESRQYAESLFLSRELFATEGRRGVLLLVSLFERQVILIPDKGLRERLNHSLMEKIISGMTPLLRKGRLADALEKGLNLLTTELKPVSENIEKNELSNEIIEEEGV